MDRIEFGALKIGPLGKKHVNDCLGSNWVSMGPKTQILEEKFAELMDTKYAVATSSGTSSLVIMTLALKELSKKEVVYGKSKVICPALAFIANSTAIVSGGLIPKWVDIKPHTLNIDEDLVEQSIDNDVVAIYAVGTMGRPSNMVKLKEIADRHGLILFEDGCENYGSKIDGELSHKFAIGGCSSFFQAHLIQAGEGSCIYTDNEHLRDLAISIRSHGRDGNSAYFDHIRFGSNFKTTDLCSSLALEGIDQFHENIAARKYVWQSLVDFSDKFKDRAWFSFSEKGIETMPHGFSITLKDTYSFKNGYSNQMHILKSSMDDHNIHWKRNFGFCGDHEALCRFYDNKAEYPWARWCGDFGLHIGTHRYIDQDGIDRICDAIEKGLS
jgi:dTDP-4-amino-4,6-dideoxygalactose transaminase